MKTMKVFMTSEIPGHIRNYMARNRLWEPDGFYSYHIGYFVAEAKANQDDPHYAKGYPEEDVSEAKAFDQWLISQGAADGEVVLFEHG